jgi:hypothetical protein
MKHVKELGAQQTEISLTNQVLTPQNARGHFDKPEQMRQHRFLGVRSCDKHRQAFCYPCFPSLPDPLLGKACFGYEQTSSQSNGSVGA